MKLVDLYRERILEKFVKDGDSWAKARRGYELTLGLQTRAVSMMADWVGGAFVNRDKKGDPGDRPPVEVVPAEQQREALKFVIDTSFNDDAYGLTPEIARTDERRQMARRRAPASIAAEATWPIHDRILGMQASALTMVMNPTTLRRVYDNELRLPPDQDALTLPELLTTISNAVWSELKEECPADRNDRKPMISSLRRNLQREHIQRLIDLVLESPNDTRRPTSRSAIWRDEFARAETRDGSLAGQLRRKDGCLHQGPPQRTRRADRNSRWKPATFTIRRIGAVAVP